MKIEQTILASEHPAERSAFRTLTAVLFILVALYLYFVSSSILNVIARKQALSEGAQLGTAIGSYEKEYFAISETVKPEAGESLGLSPVKNTAYVYRPGAVGQALTLNNEI